MKISVNKYTLEPKVLVGGTAGSHGLEKLEFDFSPEWNELCRTVTFFPPKSVAKCVSFSGSVLPLPAEVTARAGRTAFVLCGAKDGAAIITLSGVIEVAESMLPENELTEYTPGALEQVTLLCEEARVDAQTAAECADTATASMAQTEALAAEVAAAHGVITDVYDDVMDGTAVHAEINESNSLDRAHPPSVAGVLDRIGALLSVLCPLRVKCVSTLPSSPAGNTIYIKDGKPMVYTTEASYITLYCWTPTYINGGGPGQIFSFSQEVTAGNDLYWSGSDNPSTAEELVYFDKVVEVSEGVCTLEQYGECTLALSKELSVHGEGEAEWRELTADFDMTPYLMENPGRWVMGGGAE